MPSFNDEQLKVLATPLHQNVAVSAGAGSGKTTTLTEKVSLLLTNVDPSTQEKLKPSELLVLTFTNNSAHDMKTKIIARCQEYKGIADQILSSHIQTFDSFSAFLVNKYAKELGIADNIQVADDNVIGTKLLKTVDEILAEYYENDYSRILATLKKLSLHDESPLKKIIIDLYYKLNNLLDEEKEEYIKKATSECFSISFFDSLLDEYVAYYRKRIVEEMQKAYFIYKYKDELNMDDFNFKNFIDVFSNKSRFMFLENDIDTYDFNTPLAKEMSDVLKGLLKKTDSKEFIKEVKIIYEEKVSEEGVFRNGQKIGKADKPHAPVLNRIFSSADALLADFKNIGKLEFDLSGNYSLNLDDDYNKIVSFKDDIKLLFEIVQELDKRLFEYQRSSNCYTFSTISKMALRLLKNKDVAEKVRSTFKYIMIDEYQDTNDLQEAVINILLEPRKDGTKSTLFVVGDPKQSIYAFRNSNVELFKARLVDPITNPLVIDMNKNYRSGKPLLNDINYIFKHYMSLNHGGIDYLKPGEALDYDDVKNVYSAPYNNFGVKRIISNAGIDYDGLTSAAEKAAWEALAIINDIKNKMNDPQYMISAKENGTNVIRRPHYSDFSILVRVKSGYDLYARLFSQYNIPLNIDFDEILTEVDAIILIQSLINMMAYIMGIDKSIDIRHTFASIARSYIYNYEDDDLFNILTDEGNVDPTDLTKIKEDKIYKEVEEFINDHLDASFSKIYLDMLVKFKILEKLYLIGKVSDNTSKIESFYSIILAQERAREGMKELIELMKNMSKYKLDLEATSKVSLKDAVDLMSIHASKGLEKKIVYLPNSYNRISRGSNFNIPDYVFSKEHGLILPHYAYDIEKVDDKDVRIKEGTYKTLLSYVEDLKENIVDRDEHVRLFYVALTRAENTIYIVGDPSSNNDDKNNENMYGMLNYCPHYPVFNPSLLANIDSIVPSDIMDPLRDIVGFIKLDKIPLTVSDFSSQKLYDDYIRFFEEFGKNILYEKLSDLLDKIEFILTAYYYQKSPLIFSNLDSLAILFAKHYYHIKVASFNELDLFLRNGGQFLDDEGNEMNSPDEVNADSYDEKTFTFVYEETEQLKNYLLNEFANALKNVDLVALGITFKNLTKKVTDVIGTNNAYPLKKDFLLPFAYILDNVDYIYYWSYENKKCNYFDEVIRFDYLSFKKGNDPKKPVVDKSIKDRIDDSNIEFEPRIKERASKKVEEADNDLSSIFEEGKYLHRLLELVDFKTKDVSFIPNERDRKLIKEVLELPIFDEVNNADEVYKEYGYYDIKRMSRGFIDLFFISTINGKKTYTIVDYKSSHTRDDGYSNQLHIYKENIIRLFNLDEKDVDFRLYLLSIKHKKLYEVD